MRSVDGRLVVPGNSSGGWLGSGLLSRKQLFESLAERLSDQVAKL
jgi:hypothetical protein